MAETRRLRVLVVGLAWPPETFLHRLLTGLAATPGMDVVLALAAAPTDPAFSRAGLARLPAPNWAGPMSRRLGRLGAMSLRARFRNRREAEILRRHARTAAGVVGRLRASNRLLPFAGFPFDAVYFPWNSAAIDYGALCDFGRPTLVSCRGSQVHVAPHDPEQTSLRDGLREAFARVTAVHCVSEATVREAERWGLDRSKARVIRPAVDPEFFRPSSETGNRPDRATLEIVTTGSLVPIKGHEFAFLAIRRLLDRGVAARLTVIGDGADRTRLQYTIRDLGLGDAVRLAGRLAPDAVRRQIHESDVFLLSSLSEGISNAVLEAMACGLPTVTTACGGMAEVVRDGVEGFVVPVADPDAMAGALAGMASDAGRRRTMGEAARQRIVEGFDLRAQIAAFAGLFERLASCEAA